MSEIERKDRYVWTGGRWSSWDSPVGLGLFFVLTAVAVELFRLTFK